MHAGRMIALAIAVAIFLSAQQPNAQRRRFEVATIKPSAQQGVFGGGLGNYGGGFVAQNQTLYDLVWYAYRGTYWHKGLLLGGPEWAKSARFDVQAKPSGDFATPDEMRGMLRELLAERFQLKIHEEAREAPVFALVVDRTDDKTRAKLRPTPAAEAAYCEQLRARPPEAQSVREMLPDGSRRCAGSSGGGLQLRWRARPVGDLAEVLVEIMDRPVVDRTGLQGYYDIDLDLEREMSFDHLLAEEGVSAEGNVEIVDAIRRQLGLKLESMRAPAQVIVIDSAERPTEN